MFRHLLCFPPGRTPIVIIIMNIILAFIYCHNHPCDNLIIIILVLILITVLVVNNVITLQSPKWPKSGMSPRKWPLPQKRKCFWGWDPSNDSDDMLRWQNARFKNKKLTFSPKYKNSGVKIWHFWPWRHLGSGECGPTSQCLQHERGVITLLVHRYGGTKIFVSSQKK